MSSEIDYDTPVPEMAPSDLHWHRQYAKTFALMGKYLDELRAHPSMEGAEDLGDYTETISDLLSFRPHTRPDIEKDVMKEVFHLTDEDVANIVSKYTPDNKED